MSKSRKAVSTAAALARNGGSVPQYGLVTHGATLLATRTKRLGRAEPRHLSTDRRNGNRLSPREHSLYVVERGTTRNPLRISRCFPIRPGAAFGSASSLIGLDRARLPSIAAGLASLRFSRYRSNTIELVLERRARHLKSLRPAPPDGRKERPGFAVRGGRRHLNEGLR
jgi:hypothetical protein